MSSPSLSALAFTHRRLVFLVTVALMAGGLASFVRLPAREDPAILIREAVVTTRFPGLEAERVEQLITRPLEEAVRQMPEVEQIRSTTYDGVSIIHVEVGPTHFDLDPIWTDLRQRVEEAAGELPDGAFVPLVNDDFGDVAVVTAALTGDGYEPFELREVAERIEDRLYQVPGTKRVDVLGLPREVVVVELDGARLAAADIDESAVARSLRGHNVLPRAGDLDYLGERSFAVVAEGDLQGLDDLRAVLVRSRSGVAVPLGSVADVRRSAADPTPMAAYYGAEPAAVFAVTMLDGQRVLDYTPRARAAIDELAANLPAGLALRVFNDQAEPVASTVYGVTLNVLQTLLIVLAVVVLFLGLRTGLVVGSIVPAVVLVTLAVMGVFTLPLERMSLATIVIALGLLVDNGIVIAEDFQLRLREGVRRVDALGASSRELAIPLLSSSLTTVLFFLPLMLAAHESGEYTRSISLLILITLSVSWLFALLVTPTLCFLFVRPPVEGADGSWLDRAFDRLGGAYERVLRWVLVHRALVGVGVVASLALGVALMAVVPKKFFPDSDRTEVLVYLDLPNDVSAATTDQRMREILARLAREPGLLDPVLHQAAYVGFGGPRFVLSLTPTDPAPNKAFMVLKLRDQASMEPTVDRLRDVLRAEFPDVFAEVTTMFLGPSDSRVMEVQVRGPDYAVLLEAADEVEAILRSVPATIDVHHDWQEPRSRLRLEVDRQRVHRAGTSHRAVADAALSHLEEAPLTRLREGDDRIPIVARRVELHRHDPGHLLTASVSPAAGRPVPLAQLGELRFDAGPSLIERQDLVRSISVRATNLRMAAEDMVAPIQGPLDELQARLPAGHRVVIDGIVVDSLEGQAALGANVPLCFALVIALLVAQFNSLRRAAVILLTIPLVVVGAALGLTVLGHSFGFMVILGLYALAGIIVNNAIVLIDRIDIERADADRSLTDAVVSASKRRLRPILMTTVTTVVGLLPLIVGDDVLFGGMASAMAFGLTFGTLLTLGVVPMLYTLFFPEPKADTAA